MESKMASDTVAVRQSKVTLTNWERLNNAPLLLPKASAVQWNDHVFVLAHDGTALLYHPKSNIWSMLPKSPYISSNTAPPALALHNRRILTMSKSGQLASFDPRFGDWTEVKDMNMRLTTKYDLVLVSYNSNLYAIAALDSMDPETPHFIKDCCTIYLLDLKQKWERWTPISEFGQGPLQSAAIINGTAFVHTGGKIYKALVAQLIPNTQCVKGPSGELTRKPTPREPFGKTRILLQKIDTKIASPPYVGCTLYAIKDTLFSFGGRDRGKQPTSDVLRYNPDTNTWESAGYMRSARYNVAVTTMQDTTLDVFVLGGSFGSSKHTVKKRVYAVQSIDPNPPIWNDNTSILEKCTVN